MSLHIISSLRGYRFSALCTAMNTSVIVDAELILCVVEEDSQSRDNIWALLTLSINQSNSLHTRIDLKADIEASR